MLKKKKIDVEKKMMLKNVLLTNDDYAKRPENK